MKIQKKSDITPTLPFTEFDFLQSYRDSFAKSELGCVSIPSSHLRSWQQHVRVIAIRASGAKVNNIQIDGISFIEHHSFEAFNEGVRLKQCVEYQESLTGVKVKRVGADSIYANNANRTMCTEKGITTCFVRKGPKPKEESECLRTARKIIRNLRATVMEGSFGNQKQHYAVGRIKARNMFSETLLLFFGIHTANAAILAARQMARDMKKVA